MLPIIAACHEFGTGGVTKDYLEAWRLYKIASAKGLAKATVSLNKMDEKNRTECPLLGKQVKITCTSRDDLNRRVGLARSFDEAKGRYVVRLRGAARPGARAGPSPASKAGSRNSEAYSKST